MHGRFPRILFVRPDHIGDVLLTLPAVARLRRALPGAFTAYAAPPAAAAVAERCPHVDEAICVPFPSIGRRDAAGFSAPAALHAAAALTGSFDAALVLRPDDPWSGQLVAAAEVPVRLGFDMPRTRPYLTEALPAPRGQHVSLDGVQLVGELLRHLGVGEAEPRALEASFVPTAADEAEATEVLAAHGADEHPVVLHPGSGWPLKNWPARRWRRLVPELEHAFGSTPLVTGTATEAALVREVAEGAGAVGLAGRLSLGALAALHRRARLVVTTDSGALHLAAVMGAPVVGLFGPGDPVLFAPLAPAGRVRVVRAGLPCSPCGTLEHPPCGAAVEPECVTRIAVADVVRAAVELVPATRSAPCTRRSSARPSAPARRA